MFLRLLRPLSTLLAGTYDEGGVADLRVSEAVDRSRYCAEVDRRRLLSSSSMMRLAVGYVSEKCVRIDQQLRQDFPPFSN